MSLADLFAPPPQIRVKPSRVVRLANVAPAPIKAYRGPVYEGPVEVQPAAPSSPSPQAKVVKPTRYSRLTDEKREARKRQSNEWYYANRARALAQANARYQSKTPEQRAAMGAANRARARARRAAQKMQGS